MNLGMTQRNAHPSPKPRPPATKRPQLTALAALRICKADYNLYFNTAEAVWRQQGDAKVGDANVSGTDF